jgi:hypothetical protein
MVQGQPWTKVRGPTQKENKARGVAQVVDHLPSRHEAQSSHASTTINK